MNENVLFVNDLSSFKAYWKVERLIVLFDIVAFNKLVLKLIKRI